MHMIDQNGLSPIHHACTSGMTKVVETILNNGGDPNVCCLEKGVAPPLYFVTSAHPVSYHAPYVYYLLLLFIIIVTLILFSCVLIVILVKI